MRNKLFYGLCNSCKKPHVLHSKGKDGPQGNFETEVWEPLSDLWYEIVLPARDHYEHAINGERQARFRICKRRSSNMDYQNAISVSSRAWGHYQEAIRVADRQVDPLARLIWGECQDDQPLITYGVICEPGGFLKFTDESMSFSDAARKVNLDEKDFAAIVECSGLLGMALAK